MATKSRKADKYSNLAYATVTETGANTLTFSEIQTGMSTFDKVAWIIHEIWYFMSVTDLNKIVANGDEIVMGLSVSNKMTTPDLSDVATVDVKRLDTFLFGSPTSAQLYEMPFKSSFSQMPGGGLIVPPRPIYLFAQGQSVATACTVQARIFFTCLNLSPADYWELVEARRMIE